jgi:AbrB family looped-hinge helix DNA binding protein
MRVTLREKNQLTLPAPLARAAGWSAGDELDVEFEGGAVSVRKAPPASKPPTVSVEDFLSRRRPLRLPDGLAVADLLAADRDGAE